VAEWSVGLKKAAQTGPSSWKKGNELDGFSEKIAPNISRSAGRGEKKEEKQFLLLVQRRNTKFGIVKNIAAIRWGEKKDGR